MENVEMKIRHYEKRQKFLTKKKKKWDNMNLIFYGLNYFHVSWYLFLALAVSSLIWKFSEGYIFMVMIIYKVLLFPARKLAEKKVARYTKRLKELTEEVNENIEPLLQRETSRMWVPYNNEITAFPAMIVAGLFGYKQETFIDEENGNANKRLKKMDVDFGQF